MQLSIPETVPLKLLGYRYKITLEYIGTDFCGWQKQKDALAVQEVIEEAIYSFSSEKVTVFAAGRTDAGVHAYNQVAHFDLLKCYNDYTVMGAINNFCRKYPVGVTSCKSVSNDFHARFSAVKRHYVYKILNRKEVNIIHHKLRYWLRDPLDIITMQNAAAYLIGKHDFTSFRSKECQAISPIKTLDRIQIVKTGNEVDMYFSAPSFLHNMVRNIVGSLLLVGRGRYNPEKINEILLLKDRTRAGPMAPAEGLYFLGADY